MFFFLLYDHCADTVFGKCFENNRMRDSSIYYVCTVDTTQYCIKTAFDLGDHAAFDNALLDEFLDVFLVQNRNDIV